MGAPSYTQIPSFQRKKKKRERDPHISSLIYLTQREGEERVFPLFHPSPRGEKRERSTPA